MIFHFSLFTFPFQRRQPFFTFLPLNSVHDEPCQISKVDDGEHGTFPALHLIGRAAEEPHEQHAGEHHDEVECGYASYVHGLDEARYADDHEDVKHVGAYHVAYGYVAFAFTTKFFWPQTAQQRISRIFEFFGAPDKPCGVGCADANPKLLLNDT